MTAVQARSVPSVPAQALMFVAVSLAMLGNYYAYDSVGPVARYVAAEQLGTA